MLQTAVKGGKGDTVSCLFHDRRLLVSLQDKVHTKMNGHICSISFKRKLGSSFTVISPCTTAKTLITTVLDCKLNSCLSVHSLETSLYS